MKRAFTRFDVDSEKIYHSLQFVTADGSIVTLVSETKFPEWKNIILAAKIESESMLIEEI